MSFQTGGTMADKSGYLAHQFFGQIDCGAGISGITIGSDIVRESLGDRGTTDHDLGVGQVGRLEDAHRFLHGWHCSSEQGGEADDVGIVFLCGGKVFLGAHIGAEVDDGETGTAPHHGNEVLADVVQIALHGADDDGVFRLDARRGEQWLEELQRFLHGAGGNEHLGDEYLIAFELFADDRHAGHEALLDNSLRAVAGREEFLGQPHGVSPLSGGYGGS